jgi:hypothetical protein
MSVALQAHIINQAPQLSDYEFSQIEHFLRGLPISIKKSTGIVQQVINILMFPQKYSETIYVIRGIHSTPLDSYGPYHFNIRIGASGPTHHVYINPVLYQVDNQGINIDDKGTVSFTCPFYWAYQLTQIT